MDINNEDGVSSRENKRRQFSEPASSSKKPVMIILALVLLGGAIAGYFAIAGSSNRPTVVNNPASPASEHPSDDIQVSVNAVSSGKAKFFDYKLANSQQVRFFVVKSSSGDYRAALDACDVCAHAKKGYHQEGDDMICNNCGKHFPTSLIGKISGGCHPIGLNPSIDGNSIAIKKSELEAGARYF
ncbi:MAG TPA: DUF2318 domain-containing protein [Blastocatellia bacterium]|nr:DUF2318 domain-containing protein [Blastocatellia bacterium]